MIHIKNLNFSYAPGKPALRNIDLDIKRGETFGIIGPTGAGKSTLLLHLNGILKGTGKITIDNIPISAKTENEIRGKVGIVFQNPDNQLFCPTVFEDIAFGLYNSGYKKEEVKTRVDKILETLDLVELRDLSTHHLSFGEKKRVSLAAILAMEPGILCFDEPFANLDYHSIFMIIREIRRMKITRIIISQDILLALSLCDRAAVLHKGEIIRTAPAQEIARDHAMLSEIGIDYRPYIDIIKNFLPGITPR